MMSLNQEHMIFQDQCISQVQKFWAQSKDNDEMTVIYIKNDRIISLGLKC